MNHDSWNCPVCKARPTQPIHHQPIQAAVDDLHDAERAVIDAAMGYYRASIAQGASVGQLNAWLDLKAACRLLADRFGVEDPGEAAEALDDWNREREEYRGT